MKNDTLWMDKKHFAWWPISFTKYELTYNKLLVQSGLLNTTFEEIYVYRLMDCKCSISLLQRIFGTGTVTLIGLDYSTPVLELKNIKKPFQVKELLSDLILTHRTGGIVEIA